MISVSRFKKVFLILTAFVCVIASVSMKAKAAYTPMTVIKTPSLNTAMKQGDIIIDNLSDDNVKIKINDTSHFSLKKDAIAGGTVAGAGQYTYNVCVTTDNTVTYPNSIEFKDPFEVTFREAAHDKRGAAIDVTMHFNFVKFSPAPKSPGVKFDNDFVFNMYTDIHDGTAPCLDAPGGLSRILNVETVMDITTSMKYSESGKAPKGNYLTKYCDLDQAGSMNTFADYNAYPPESIWFLDGYNGNAYVSSDTTLNQKAWEEYSGRYFAATAFDDDNTIAATRSSVLAYADASSSRYRWYGYGCGTLVLVNKTGSKLTPEISTEKNVSTVYGGNTHIFNVTETGGTSGVCEIKSDFNYVRSEDMPNSWFITDTFPTGVMIAPQAKDVRVYTKPLMDVISDDGTELPDASGYKSGTTEITSQVSISRNSDGKLTVSSTDYNLVKAKRVYVEFSAPIKPWNSITSADKNGTSTKEYLNSTTTTIKTTDQTSTKTATAPLSARLNVSPHISIVKTPHLADSNGNGKADTGEKVTYTFSIRNDGNSSLSNIRLTDSLLGFTDRKVADSIATGGTKEYSAPESITVTADQARSGKIDNTATVKGTPPSGMSDVTATGKATVPTVAPAPKLTLEKTVDRKSLSLAESKVGTKLTYTFKVTNAGNVNIGNISINDKLPGVSAIKMSYPTSDGILAPGATATGTATYSLTDSDIARQGVTNTAQANGTDKATGNAVKSNESSVTTSVVQSAGLSIAKTVDKSSLAGDAAKAGTGLTYTFKISNNGNVAIDGISIRDDMAGLSNISMTWPGTSGSLGAGQSATGTATYRVKQFDVDAGTVSNTARATGTNHATGASVSSNESTATTTIDRTLRLGVSKTANPTRIPAAEAIPGKTISYAIAVKNNGNTTADISAVDSMPEIGTVSMSKSRLAPGETATATVSHAVTSGDIDAGTVSNTVTVNGRTVDGSMTTSGKATATTAIERQTPRLSIEKTVDKTSLSTGETRIGAKLSYGFTVTNTGNVAIKGISINDEFNGLGAIKMSYPSKTGELAPGEKATGKASYSITNADILAGVVTNTAKAVGKNATTGASVESGESTVTTRLVKNPSIKIEKTADPTHIAPIDAVAGKEISYSFKITNTGNVNLGDIAVDDSMKDLGTVSPAKKSLAPGESTTARATHRVTSDDIEAGSVTNTAKATGSAGGTVIKSSEATATTSIEKAVSRMSFEKTVDRKQLSGNEAKAGTILAYSFKISNGGNIPINGISIDDGLHGLSSISIDWHGHDGTIPAGSSVTGTATYKVTQEDVDAGKVDNSATASGTDAHGGKLSKTSTVSTKIERTGKLETVKSVDAESLTGDRAKAGTVLTYTVTVRNTGNVTLRNVACDDSMREIGRIALNRTELAPGGVASGTATHTVTQADVDAGTVPNSASSSADSPDASKVVSNRSTVSTSIESLPQLTVAKTAGRTHIPADEERTGEVIPYSLTVSNTGNVTVSGIELEDELAAKSLKVDWGGNAGHTLAPGQSVPASASYAISDTDVNRGIVENIAQAVGKAPNGSSVRSNVAKAATTIEKAEPALALVKTGTEQVTGDDVKPGHEVKFDFELENIGNTTLKGISVKDALRGIGDIELERDELAAGEKTSGKATYRLTQDDIDAGFVKNSATAGATTPTDVDVKSNESSHTVTIVGSPSLSIVKNVDRESVSGTKLELRKTELTYSFTVTNTGTTTVSGIKIDDAMNGLGEIKFGEKKSAPADTDGNDAADTDTDGDDTTDGDDKPDGDDRTTNTAPGEDDNSGDTADDTDGDDDASGGEESSGKDDVSDDKGIVLAPGESIDATATYKLSDSDIEAGTVVNRAKARGTLPNGDDIVSDESEAVTKITIEPDAVDIMQTGMTVAIPAAIAIACVSVIVSMARCRRNRR